MEVRFREHCEREVLMALRVGEAAPLVRLDLERGGCTTEPGRHDISRVGTACAQGERCASRAAASTIGACVSRTW